MAVSRDARLIFAILLITCCFTQTLTQVPSDCCLKVKNMRIGRARVADYYQQIRGQGCFIDAIVLVTKRGRNLCVPPGEPWVRKLTKQMDKLKKRCQKVNYQIPRCLGVGRDV